VRPQSLIPAPARRFIKAYHRKLSFRRAIERSAGAIARGDLPAEQVGRLSYGWGNEGYSGETLFLSAVVRHAALAKGPILECGSGLSTVLLSIATRDTGTEVWSLEHHAQWADRVRKALREERATRTHVEYAPLKNYGAFDWYQPDFSRLPRQFSLVLCDGPPGDTHGGRSGLVPVMRQYLAPGSVILIDDAERDAERSMAEQWARELSATLAIEGHERQLGVLTLPS
jgi:predicted O-methyltransferase YrrM